MIEMFECFTGEGQCQWCEDNPGDNVTVLLSTGHTITGALMRFERTCPYVYLGDIAVNPNHVVTVVHADGKLAGGCECIAQRVAKSAVRAA